MFDLVIQGPLNNISLQHVERYHFEFENIIVSHWDSDDTSKHPNYKKLGDWKIIKGEFGGRYKNLAEIVSQPLPDRKKTFLCDKKSTFFYSICSTYAGLKKCKSPYVVKMRSDEYYLNLKPLKEKFLKDTNKMVCGNIFFKKWNIRHFHIGDHIFIARTKTLIKAYEILFSTYASGFYMGDKSLPLDQNPTSPNWVEQGLHNNVAEQILALAFLTAKSIDSSNWISQKTLMQNFSSVDINLLAPYIAQWQTGGEIYSDCFHSGKTFKSSEEIIESF